MFGKPFNILNIFLILISIAVSGHAATTDNGDFGMIINTGMPQGKNSNCALRDKYGFMWVGTTTGLCCFDGNGRSTFSSWAGVLESTERSNINTIFEHDDDIWFSDINGLSVFSRNDNKSKPFVYKTKYGVPISSKVQEICETNNGTIWILTHGQGLFIFDEKKKTLTQNSRHGIFYHDMAVGKDGRIYTVCMDGTINIFNAGGGHINSFQLPGYASDKRAIRMTSVGDNIWISAHNTLYRYNIENSTISRQLESPDFSQINCLLPGRNGKLLLGTDTGVWSYNIAENRIEGKDLNETNVTHLAYDCDGSVAALSRFGGLIFMLWKPKDFIRLPFSPAPDINNRITDMRLSADGKGVWIGTERGISYFDIASRSLRHNAMPVGHNINVSDMTVFNDILCVGTLNDGVILWDTTTDAVKEFAYSDVVPYAVLSNDIKRVYRTSGGDYYILTGWGVCRFDPRKGSFTTIGEIDSHVPFNVIQEDHAGRVWLADASNSLYMKEHAASNFTSFKSKSVGDSPVRLMYLDTVGTLWLIDQANRIYTFDEDKHDFVSIDVELPKDSPIINVFNDADGNLWLGWSYGLTKLSPEKTLSYFTYPSAANANSFTMAACPLPDGHILFSCDDNLWIFDPHKMGSDSHTARAYVQSISFPYAENSIEELKRLGLDILLYTRDTIEIPYTDNTFTLVFSASRGSDMPEIRYDYKLEGVDNGWVRDAGPEVTYTNLAPGSYTFLLKPSFGSDLETKKLSIVVLPPWYRTLWAYAAYILLFILLAMGMALVFRNRMRRHYNRRIEAMRVQKEKETYESKMKFFINLVHEIRTPLTLISLPLEKMADDVNSGNDHPEDNKKHISSIRRNVNYLLGIVSQLLEFHKAGKGKEVKLALEFRDVGRFLTEIVNRFEHPLESTGKHIELHLPADHVIATFDPDKVDRMVMNLIGNAVKYSRSKIDITLSTPDDGHFTITVSDDGTGVPAEELDKVFDSYYQVAGDDVAEALGTGMGLAYVKLMARVHGGGVKAENTETGGARFTITLPLTAAETYRSAVSGITAPDATEPKPASLPEGKELSLLLVDDNTELLSTMVDLMPQQYRILTATNGEDALKLLDEDANIDFIISDFMMPGMSGTELCRKVKSDVRFSHIPFIILTAKTNSEAKEEGMECGADVYIEKPFTIKQLTLQIANMVKTRRLFYSRISSGEVSAEDTVEEAPYINKVDAKFIETLNNHIRDKVQSEEFSIDELVALMNMSRSSFYRKLKSVTGMSPNDYLKNFRLDYAARLLLDGMRVTEAGEQSGFTSSSYFSKCFKTRFGMSPREYQSANTPDNNSAKDSTNPQN